VEGKVSNKTIVYLGVGIKEFLDSMNPKYFCPTHSHKTIILQKIEYSQ